MIQFYVIPSSSRAPSEGRDAGYLWTDNWNDWWEFRTLYVLTFFDAEGKKHELGGVKIGQFDWQKGQDRPSVPDVFSALDDKFFSLGQDVSYYSSIAALGTEVSGTLLSSLKDIVADPTLFGRAASERVTGNSLMRSVTLRSIEGQFKRVLDGGAPLTNFSFTYDGPKPDDEQIKRLKLKFQVTPDSKPPTNIHVMIGRNGVGKSFLLNGMTRALVAGQKDEDADGIFSSQESIFTETSESPFANIVSVTFSAFDDFKIIPESRNALKGVQYSNVGLRERTKSQGGDTVIITRDPTELAEEFSLSAKICVIGQRGARWRQALTTLQADPIFEEAQVASLVGVEDSQFRRQAAQLFRKLSSGHKIVLLTITKLVEKVEEKTLVLLISH